MGMRKKLPPKSKIMLSRWYLETLMYLILSMKSLTRARPVNSIYHVLRPIWQPVCATIGCWLFDTPNEVKEEPTPFANKVVGTKTVQAIA